jgi:hypothetical protein
MADLRRKDGRHLLPPSRSHEGDLAKRLSADTPLPDGFDLAGELIRRVRAGTVSLAPTATSGWYDWQTWALEPLAEPARTPEAARLKMDGEYRKWLEDLFKSVLALTRETHVKQLEDVAFGAGFGGRSEPVAHVRPDLSLEPLVTHYERRAAGYAFVRSVLEDAFGPEALRAMHRLTAEGPATTSLDDELAGIAALFAGAAAAAKAEVGLAAAHGSAGEPFRAWKPGADPDLGGDIRMMVPVFHDLDRGQTKVWAVLGWSSRQIEVGFAVPPDVLAVEPKARVAFAREFHHAPYPVFAEVYVSRLLDRDEFRRRCDRHRTRSAILAAL